ncbi:MAG: DUF3306 domain-containing protein [Burkholderiaceae bacterium]|nr:DUF3306 domain-containing protein [Burkholderiaceae bacterium]
MTSEPESFLARWSRRKRAAEREVGLPEQRAAEAPATPGATVDGAPAARTEPASQPSRQPDPSAKTEEPLPSIESLDGLRSDYQAFFNQPVDESLRRAALKKLFADPHFNQMDMLDVYVDDYTQFEPLPAALRMRLPSARAFLPDSERAELEAAEAQARTGGEAPEGGEGAPSEECGAATEPEAEGEGRVLADEGAGAEATSAPTTPAGAVPAAESTGAAVLPPSPDIAPCKANVAPDPNNS